jgi:choline dehydrogenase
MSVKSADPLQYSSIQPNYLSAELDRRVAVAGIKVAHRIAAAPSLAPLITEEFVPGPAYLSDEELLEAARLFSQTIYHPTSICRMGRDDRAAVDARLRVREIERLRVADAPIAPGS